MKVFRLKPKAYSWTLLLTLLSSACENVSNRHDDLYLSCGVASADASTFHVVPIRLTHGEAAPNDLQIVASTREGDSEQLTSNSKACLVIAKDKYKTLTKIYLRDSKGDYFAEVETGDALTSIVPNASPRDKAELIAFAHPIQRLTCASRLNTADTHPEIKILSDRSQLFTRKRIHLWIENGQDFKVYEKTLMDDQLSKEFDLALPVLKEGQYKIRVTTEDIFDNIFASAQKVEQVCDLSIDLTPPTIESGLSQKLLNFSSESQAYRVSPEEPISFRSSEGDATLSYCFARWSSETSRPEPCEAKLPIIDNGMKAPDEGKWDVYFTAVDKAGNRSPILHQTLLVFRDKLLVEIELRIRSLVASQNAGKGTELLSGMNEVASLYRTLNTEEKQHLSIKIVQDLWDLDRVLRIRKSLPFEKTIKKMDSSPSGSLWSIRTDDDSLYIYDDSFKLLKIYDHVRASGFAHRGWWVETEASASEAKLFVYTGEEYREYKWGFDRVLTTSDLQWTPDFSIGVFDFYNGRTHSVYILRFNDYTYETHEIPDIEVNSFMPKWKGLYQFSPSYSHLIVVKTKGLEAVSLRGDWKSTALPSPTEGSIDDITVAADDTNHFQILAAVTKRTESSGFIRFPYSVETSKLLLEDGPALTFGTWEPAPLDGPEGDEKREYQSFPAPYLMKSSSNPSNLVVYRRQFGEGFIDLFSLVQGISGHLKITVPFADTISLSLAFDDFRRQLVAITDKIYFYRFGSDQPYLEESIEALRGKAYTFLSKGRMITGMENMFNVHELYERLMPEIRAVSYDIADMNRLLILPSAMFKDGRAYNKAKRWLAYPDRDTDSIQIIDQFGAHYGSIAIKPGEIVTALAFTPDGNGLWIATYGSGSLVRIAFYELHDLKNARLSKAYDDIGHISQFIPIKGSSPKAYILYLGSGQEMTLLGMDGVRQAIDVSAFEIQSEPQVLDGLDLTIIGELKTQARNIVALDLEGTVKVLPVSPTSDNRYRVYPSMDQKSYWFCGVATSRCDRFKLGSDDLSLTIESDSNMPWSLKKMASYDALDDRGLSFMHFQDGRLLFLKKNPGDGTILKRQEYADIASYGKISETYWYALTRDANLLVLSMADGSRRFEYKLPVVKSLLCSNDEASFGSKRFCPDFKVHFDKDNEIINVFYTETNSSLAFRFKQLLLRPDALIERMESWEQR